MLLEAQGLSKSMGAKYLFTDLRFSLMEGEKIALIGRNGQGKTTLLKMLCGEDHDFEGKLIVRKGVKIILTKQEHITDIEQTSVEYILKSVPHFLEYKKILDDYENGLNENLDPYLHAIEYFTEHKYFHLESSVENTLIDFGISAEDVKQPLSHLSGGEKRYVEMARLMFSKADLLLVDEPTNHMDYAGKDRFTSWFKSTPQAVLVVTHDRDVLKHVSKIIELKDQKIQIFKGNYDAYISQNSLSTLSSVKLYTDQLNRLKEAKKRVEWGLQMRAKSKEWKTRYDHWLRDYEKLKTETVKPSFWIDQNSVENLDKKVVDNYHKFKEKNIKISTTTKNARGTELIAVRNLSLGYTTPVFTNVNFTLKDTDRIFIKGKNGAGKSTLVRTLFSLWQEQTPKAKVFEGEIRFGTSIKIGEYEQEISQKYLSLSLDEAVKLSYAEKDEYIEDRQVKSLLAQYLFNPTFDGKQKIAQLSGGQKARFQLIKMLIGEPNLLILDEPTNHLDLPSIEELENALENFQGGILYISHDTYFIKKMGGAVVEI